MILFVASVKVGFGQLFLYDEQTTVDASPHLIRKTIYEAYSSKKVIASIVLFSPSLFLLSCSSQQERKHVEEERSDVMCH